MRAGVCVCVCTRARWGEWEATDRRQVCGVEIGQGPRADPCPGAIGLCLGKREPGSHSCEGFADVVKLRVWGQEMGTGRGGDMGALESPGEKPRSHFQPPERERTNSTSFSSMNFLVTRYRTHGTLIQL